MGAKGYMNTIMDEVCYMCNRGTTCEECGSFLVIKKAIAEAQLEAVEKALSLRPLSLCLNYSESLNAYMHELRKAAGRGE